jgi:streptogramin lyase
MGGNSGSGNNPAIALVAGLGESCTASGFSSIYVVVNEVSTIAAAFAGAGFATDATHVSSSGSTLAVKGVEDAYAAILNLASVSTGVANSVSPGGNGNGTVPQAEVNTLANILAACVNSTGSTSSACTTLFNNALSGGTTGTPPTDTTTAALNIAHNPGANIANLCGLQTATSPFQPDLSCAAASLPNDFTIAITYTGGGLSSPWGLAIDEKGDVWTTDGNNGISKFNVLGVPISGSPFTGGGLIDSLGIALNTDGNPWVTNGAGSPARISDFSSNGTAISGAGGYTGGGLTGSQAIAFDASGNVWVADQDTPNGLSEFSISGTANASSPFTGGGLNVPQAIAIDVSGNIWCANNSGNSISEFNSSGVANGSAPFTGGGLVGPKGIAIDAAGNIWVANNSSNGISEFDSSGTAKSGSPFSSGDVNGATSAIAIDGNGNVWAAGQESFLEYSSSGTPITGSNGYQPGLYGMQGIAIDGSGNVWATSFSGGTLTELVGAAAPVVTPIVANLLSPYGSHAVNKP